MTLVTFDSSAPHRSGVFFSPAQPEDFEWLLALRIEAMRESLQRLGRFDVDRARDRFASSFVATGTRHIEAGGQRIGFVATRAADGHLWLDHLYIHPGMQRRGYGAIALAHVIEAAALRRLPIRVGALKLSDSNGFYVRHGFELVGEGEFDNYYVRPCDASASDAPNIHPTRLQGT